MGAVAPVLCWVLKTEKKLNKQSTLRCRNIHDQAPPQEEAAEQYRMFRFLSEIIHTVEELELTHNAASYTWDVAIFRRISTRTEVSFLFTLRKRVQFVPLIFQFFALVVGHDE